MDILVVDDEKLALKNAVTELNKALKQTSREILGIEPETIDEEMVVHAFREAEEALDFINGEVVCDIALLDIEMQEISGVDLAKEIKKINPQINIIFTTAHPDYMDSAFELHASGYCLKPVTAEKLAVEIENLRHSVKKPVAEKAKNRFSVKTFGNFEAFVDGNPIKFKYSKSKELLAYLIDRNGAMCTNKELMSILWEDDIEEHFSYLKKIKNELFVRLKEAGCDGVLIQQWGSLGINPDKVDCDYFGWLKGDAAAINSYRGEYMTQYEWGEFTHGMLEN